MYNILKYEEKKVRFQKTIVIFPISFRCGRMQNYFDLLKTWFQISDLIGVISQSNWIIFWATCHKYMFMINFIDYTNNFFITVPNGKMLKILKKLTSIHMIE